MPVNLNPPDPKSLLPVTGVRLGVTQAGVRKAGRKDLLLISIDDGAHVAGVFTQNRFCAAPVVVSRQHLSMIDALFNEVKCKTNDLGVKGAGEAGACGAPGCFVSAVMDALAPLGVTHIDMPLTPDRVWRAISEAKAAQAA